MKLLEIQPMPPSPALQQAELVSNELKTSASASAQAAVAAASVATRSAQLPPPTPAAPITSMPATAETAALNGQVFSPEDLVKPTVRARCEALSPLETGLLLRTTCSVRLERDEDTDNWRVQSQVGNLTAEIMIGLKRNLESALVLPDSLATILRRENGIAFPGRLALVPSVWLNRPFSEGAKGRQESHSGNAGNVSQMFLTPHLSEAMISWVGGESSRLGWEDTRSTEDVKLLCETHLRLLEGSRVKALFEDVDENSYLMDLPTLNAKKLDDFLRTAEAEGLRARRLVFQGITVEQQAVFNMKPIVSGSDLLVAQKVKDSAELQWGPFYKDMSTAEIKKKYGFDVGRALGMKVSNNRFGVVENAKGELNRVIVFEKSKPFFPKIAPDGIPYIDESSFARAKMWASKSSNGELQRFAEGVIEFVPMRRVWEEARDPAWEEHKQGMPEEMLQFRPFLADQLARSFREWLNALQASVRIPYIEHRNRDLIEPLAQGLKKARVFRLERIADSAGERHILSVAHRDASGARCKFWKRNNTVPFTNTGADGASMRYCSLVKRNLAFEREKALGALFIEKYLDKVDPQRERPVLVLLEAPATCEDGSKGYLDAIVAIRSSDDQWISQAFEFKASVGSWTVGKQRELDEQRQKYELEELARSEGLLGPVEGSFGVMTGLPLQLSNLDELAEAAAQATIPLLEGQQPLRRANRMR